MSFSSKTIQVGPPTKTNVMYNKKPVTVYKYKNMVLRNLTYIKNYVSLYAVRRIKDYKNKEFAVNILFTAPVRNWALSKNWMKFDELRDIPQQFEYLNDSKVDITEARCEYFQILVRDAIEPVADVIIKNVGDSKNNDCLYDAILQCFNYNTDHLHRNCKTPEGFKRKLNLARTAKVPIALYQDVEALFGIKIHQSGDYVYESNSKSNIHVYLHCKGSHVELRNPPEDVKRPHINYMESDKIYTVYFNDTISIYDGNVTKSISDEEYNKLKNNFSVILVKVDALEKLVTDRESYLKTATALKELTGGLINKFKSSYDSKLSFDLFRKCSKFMVEPEALSELEQIALDDSFHGGLRYLQKGEYENVFDYDINKFYSHWLSSSSFIFPISEPSYFKLTSLEFMCMADKSFKFGLYKVVLETNHKFFNYKIGKSAWFTHHDLKIAKMLKLKFSIDETCINTLIYDVKNCVSGYKAFRDYFDKCSEWVENAETQGVPKKIVKSLMNSLWGSMCSKKKVVKRVSKDEVIELDNHHLNRIEFNEITTMLELVQKTDVFKFSWARVCFITSFCRYQMVKTILSFENINDVVYVNTDGFISKINQPTLKISDKIGDWSCDSYKKCKVLNGNSVLFEN
jgi:hypothetical protein